MADLSTGLPGSQAAGGGMIDLVSTQKGGVQTLAQLALSLANFMPAPTTTTSPKATCVNNLGTTGTTVIASSTVRHGIMIHNPATTNVIAYIYPTLATPAPTLASTGGSLQILPGGFTPFPPSQFPNMNAGFSAFVSTGTANPLTIWEFF